VAQISNLLARAIKPGQIISDISAERKTTRPSLMRLRSVVFPARRCGTYLTCAEEHGVLLKGRKKQPLRRQGA